MTSWDGGVRVAAFVGGGWGGIPAASRGSSVAAFLHVADWYATLCSLMGVDPTDDALLNGTRYPIDGLDVWSSIIGGSAPQREWLPITEHALLWHSVRHNTTFKLLTLAKSTVWYLANGSAQLPDTREEWPCVKTGGEPVAGTGESGSEEGEAAPCFVCHQSSPCLFDIVQDSAETANLATKLPDVLATMRTQLASYHSYVHGDMSIHDRAQYTCWGNSTCPECCKGGRNPECNPKWRTANGLFAGPCCGRKEDAAHKVDMYVRPYKE